MTLQLAIICENTVGRPISACGEHGFAGLVNTLEHFLGKLGRPRLHAIVGGTHLGPASDEQFAATLDYLTRLDFDRLGVSHCTGQIRSAQLYARFPNKVFFANVGTTMKVD